MQSGSGATFAVSAKAVTKAFYGLLAAAAFSLAITPLGVATLANPLLAVGAPRLARCSWTAPAFGRARRPAARGAGSAPRR